MKAPGGRRRGRPAERGAIIVETALVVGIILTFLLFSVQIGILGFLQITADAASFVGARVSTLTTAAPQSYVATTFPQVKPGDVSSASPAPVPVPTVPVDYGYNEASPPPNEQYQRIGGYSMLQPELATVSVKPSRTLSILGKLTGVQGADTEPMWIECGVHFNVAGSTAPCGSAGAPVNYEGSYFSQGEYTPAYYVGFNMFAECGSTMPWGANVAVYDTGQGDCPSQASASSVPAFYALGVAERLDQSDWNAVNPGLTGSPTGTFAPAACHQAVYAEIASFLVQWPSLDSLYNSASYGATIYNQIVVNKISSFGANGSSSGWHAWEGATPGQTTDTQIKQVYSWDTAVNASDAPLSNPTSYQNCTAP